METKVARKCRHRQEPGGLTSNQKNTALLGRRPGHLDLNLFASPLTLLSHSPTPQISCSGDHDCPSLRSTSVVTHYPRCPLYCSPHVSVDGTTIVRYNIHHHSYLLSSQSVFHLILKRSTKQHDCRLLPGYTLSTILRDRALILT